MIDADLATLCSVPTQALNQAVKRNATRFPQDFMFQLNSVEKAEVVANCDHLSELKFSKVWVAFYFLKITRVLCDGSSRLHTQARRSALARTTDHAR